MGLFDHRYKLYIHCVELVLVIAAIGLSAPALFMKNQPRTRASTIALGMGAKSIIFIQYQLLTEHVARLRRWRSFKANAVINSLEIVFWAAVIVLVVQANIKSCVGVGCQLRWGVVAIAIVLTVLSIYAAVISIKDFRESKKSVVRLEKMASESSSEPTTYQTKQSKV